MGNFTGGARAKCPYYLKEADKSISCEGVIPHTLTMIRFPTKEDKQTHQKNHCEQYNPEKGCPIAAAIEAKIAKFGDSEQKFSDSERASDLGRKIRDERVKRGYSQRELAKMSFITASHLCGIETGKTRPSIDVTVLIAEALDVDISKLLGERRV
jgi:ribosome-binding protein aMBF1 (putative translation factor)